MMDCSDRARKMIHRYWRVRQDLSRLTIRPRRILSAVIQRSSLDDGLCAHKGRDSRRGKIMDAGSAKRAFVTVHDIIFGELTRESLRAAVY